MVEFLSWTTGYWVIVVGYILPRIIIEWRLFSRAGWPGRAALIPIYTTFVEARIAQKGSWLPIAIVLLGAFTFGPLRAPWTEASIVMVGVWCAVGAYLLLAFLDKYTIGFGKRLLVVLLPIVAVFIVKDAKYIGVARKSRVERLRTMTD